MSCFRFVSLVDFFYPSQSLSACLYVFSLCQSVCLSVSHLSLRACYSLSVCLCLPVFLCVSVSLSVSVCLSRSLSLSLSLLVHVLVTLSPSLSLISLFDYVLFTLSCLSLSVCLSLSPPPPPQTSRRACYRVGSPGLRLSLDLDKEVDLAVNTKLIRVFSPVCNKG